MTPEEIIAEAIRKSTSVTMADGYKSIVMHTDVEYARIALAALGVAGYAITKLPEPFPIEVSEIDMDPTGEPEWGGEPDHRARMVVRFSGASRPGRLFDRRELAAALLAAAAVAEETP